MILCWGEGWICLGNGGLKCKLDLTLRFCCILLCVHFQNLAKPMSEKQAALICCCSYSGKQTAAVKAGKAIEQLGLVCFVFLNRTTLSTPELNLSDENTNSCYQLWCSVCSTLCACVNNPQNGKCCCLKTVVNYKLCSRFYCSAEIAHYAWIWGYLFLLSQKLIKRFAVQSFRMQKSG